MPTIGSDIRRFRLLRFSLRSFLIVTALLAIFVANRLREYHDARFEYPKPAPIGRYYAYPMVEKRWNGERRTLFLICVAEGGSSIGNVTAWPRNGAEDGIHPFGIFENGRRFPRSTDGHVWVCDNSSRHSVIMRVDLGEYEGMILPTESFGQLAEMPVWQERIEPVLDFLSLRFRLTSDVFGQGSSFPFIPEEYRDEVLGKGYGKELGATISVDDLPSHNEIEQRLHAIKERITGEKYRWTGRYFVRLGPQGADT